jgi:hypothetical protein
MRESQNACGRSWANGVVIGTPNGFSLVFLSMPGTTGLSAGHGWVAYLDPLTTGAHTIVGSAPTFTFTTKIIVRFRG